MKKVVSAIACILLALSTVSCATVDVGKVEEKPQKPTQTVEKDSTPPEIELGDMPSSLTVGQSMPLNYSVSDNESAADDIYVDVIILNASGSNVTANTFDRQNGAFVPMSTGEHTVIFEAYDEAGNCQSAEHKVSVAPKPAVDPDDPVPDMQKPSIIINAAAATELGQYITINYTVNDNITATEKIKVEVLVMNENAVDVTDTTFSETDRRFTPQAAGNYTINITATDEAGNRASATHKVAVNSALAVMPGNPNLCADREWWGGDVGVHDPSVFFDPVGKKYYAYGSHFATARSDDLMHWTTVTNADTQIFGAAKKQVLVKSYAFAGGDQNTWAPDVEYFDGKYYMYYSLTSAFGSNKSVIGRVTSNSPTGPFNQDERLIVKSNGNAGEPNAIDPELFYDEDGRLWMVYGSFFAGIYIKELYNSGSNWGLPKEDGFGKLVWKGTNNGPEGAFVFYNEQTDYYYIIASYGALSHNYNMNVARSKNPDGPFVDAAGNDVAKVAGAGNKLAGNYKFDGASQYTALGHNSIAKTPDGKYINVFHTRYELGTPEAPGAHSLRSHQILFNKDGWPVMSPARYAGESTGRVTADMAAGEYDLIIHSTGKDTDTIVGSTVYTLAEDGTVKKNGNNAGRWEISGDNYITLTVSSVKYSGVIAPSWCMHKNKATMCISAISPSGGALWAFAK